MRIWSLHPKYLDAKGIVALWRETLLAKNVLEGKTKGYRNHPQLYRFKMAAQPLEAIHYYLKIIHEEAISRNYNFDPTKFNPVELPLKINVGRGQLDYEFKHLMAKLKLRDPKLHKAWEGTKNIEVHPLFSVVKGDIATWEIL